MENPTMKKTTTNPAKSATSLRAVAPAHETIAARAASIWHRKGCPEGQDEAIWLEAERELVMKTANFDQESGNEELDALFPSNSGSATTSL
jgi:hypothetical protein